MLIIADDLTGAADTAGAFASHGHQCVVVLDRSAPVFLPNSTVVAIDADTRATDEEAAAAATAAIVGDHPDQPLYLKIDSTARGHIGATVRAAVEARPALRRVVVCPSFPALGRTVRDGVVHVDGAPLPGGDVRALLPTLAIPTHVPDASTDADLEAIVREHRAQGAEATLWVGSAGLARHLAAQMTPVAKVSADASGGHARPHRQPSTKVVVVVGSQHERTDRQVARIRADTRIARIDPREPEHVEEVLPVLREADGLVLTGGHTAHVVLTALGVSRFAVSGEVEPGIPWSTAISHGRLVSIVTKAGGFGDDLALRHCVDFLEQP